MLKSMTAYGRATTNTDIALFSVEILSVNRKHLDIQVQIPKLLNSLDMDVRKWISQAIKRGQITIRITPHFKKESPVKVSPNLPLVRELSQAWQKIATELNLEKGFSLDLLREETGILIYDEEMGNPEVLRECLRQAVQEALDPFLAMKEKEGKALQEDIQGRLGLIKSMLLNIEKNAPKATEKFREKLILAIKETLPNSIENDQRVLQEICIYAEKVDIAEEITRFKSHLDQMNSIIEGEDNAVGKQLEFMLQELGREINTIGSKSADIEIARFVIEIKTELERIREQVQNVE